MTTLNNHPVGRPSSRGTRQPPRVVTGTDPPGRGTDWTPEWAAQRHDLNLCNDVPTVVSRWSRATLWMIIHREILPSSREAYAYYIHMINLCSRFLNIWWLYTGNFDVILRGVDELNYPTMSPRKTRPTTWEKASSMNHGLLRRYGNKYKVWRKCLFIKAGVK